MGVGVEFGVGSGNGGSCGGFAMADRVVTYDLGHAVET